MYLHSAHALAVSCSLFQDYGSRAPHASESLSLSLSQVSMKGLLSFGSRLEIISRWRSRDMGEARVRRSPSTGDHSCYTHLKNVASVPLRLPNFIFVNLLNHSYSMYTVLSVLKRTVQWHVPTTTPLQTTTNRPILPSQANAITYNPDSNRGSRPHSISM